MDDGDPAWDLDDNYAGGWFGRSWGASACDPVKHLATPVGDACGECLLSIGENDQGMLIPHLFEGGASLVARHLECWFRMLGLGPDGYWARLVNERGE